MLIPFLLLVIASSFILTEPIQKFENGVQNFSSKLFLFLSGPTFIISVIFVFLVGFAFLKTPKYSSRTKCKKVSSEKKEIYRLPKEETNEIDSSGCFVEELFEEEFNEEELDDEDNGEYKSLEIGTYRRSVNIRVDEDKRYFHKKNISKDEVEHLLNNGYQIRNYKNLLSGRMENFLLQPRHNEGFMHLFLVKNISEYLEKNGIETELYITKKPDIVFQINGKKYAVEVETGSIFSKISRMKEKLDVLKDYDEWFFVITNRNKVKKYKKYGDAVDKRYVKSRLDNLIKLAKKDQK